MIRHGHWKNLLQLRAPCQWDLFFQDIATGQELKISWCFPSFFFVGLHSTDSSSFPWYSCWFITQSHILTICPGQICLRIRNREVSNHTIQAEGQSHTLIPKSTWASGTIPHVSRRFLWEYYRNAGSNYLGGSKIEFPSNNLDESNSNLDTVPFIASANLFCKPELQSIEAILRDLLRNESSTKTWIRCAVGVFWEKKNTGGSILGTHGPVHLQPFVLNVRHTSAWKMTHMVSYRSIAPKKTRVVTLLYEKCWNIKWNVRFSGFESFWMSEWHTKGMANSCTSVAHAFLSSQQCNLWRNGKNGRFSDLVVKRNLGHVRPLVCSGKAGSSVSACPTFYRLVWAVGSESSPLISVALPTMLP